MAFRLIPRAEGFFELFNELAKRLVTSAALLRDLFGNPHRLDELAAAIKEIEHEADHITHDVSKRLDSSFITPLDREDIHMLASRLVLLLPTITPWVLGTRGSGLQAVRQTAESPVAQPRLVDATVPDPAGAAPVATLPDSLFDHSADVEFILDPVVLHRGRAQAVSNLPNGVQAEQTVISF